MSKQSEPAGAGGLRERNKTKRREAILDAAIDLLDGPETEGATAERVAELAQVSVATVYNLVGTREELLVALLDRLIADLVATTAAKDHADDHDRDPIASLRRVISASVDRLTERPDAYRKVVRQLCATGNDEMHTKLNPMTVAAAAFAEAQQNGDLGAGLDPSALGAQLYLSYNGALLRWAVGALDDTQFETAALHGLATVVAAGATDSARPAALADLEAIGAQLDRCFRSGTFRAPTATGS